MWIQEPWSPDRLVLTGPRINSMQSKGLAFLALELKRISSMKYGKYEISSLVEW